MSDAAPPPARDAWGAWIAWAWWLPSVVAGVACAATAAFALGTLTSRPLDGTEGLLLFDASRIRAHLPLYVAPAAGMWDYGPVPSRAYVLHTPLWAALLALAPGSVAAPLARALALGAWLGLLAGTALGARPENRRAAWLGALFLGGAYPLTLFAAAGRHDAPALLLAGIALLRSMRRGRAGAVEGALFALAAFVKPNVLGAAAGVLGATAWTERGRAWPALAGFAGVAGLCATGLHVVSGGAWIEHLLRSTQTTPVLALWLEQLGSRLPFFALPLAAAGACAWRARRTDAGRTGLWALAASAAWAVVSLAKVGSASNYWMEPCFVGLAIASMVPLPPMRAIAAAAALVQALWVGMASVRSALEGLERAPAQAAALARVRSSCGAGPDGVVLADEAGLEQMVDGRVVQVPFVMTALARDGRWPVALWEADVRRDAVRCLVMQSDLLERPLGQVDRAHDVFDPAMRRALRDRFAPVSAGDGLWVYAAR
jgi:hypothetical protein